MTLSRRAHLSLMTSARRAGAASWHALLCAVLLPALAWAQQDSPLRGQGVNPVAGNATSDPVPVYLSAVVKRVADIDDPMLVFLSPALKRFNNPEEKHYKFEAILDVYMSWSDPRAEAGSELILQEYKQAATTWQPATEACANSSTAAACIKAATEWWSAQTAYPSCTKLCSPSNPLSCCDGVWLPDLELPTTLGLSQDRFTMETINRIGAVPKALVRYVRMQGVFSNSFNFRRFPFDSQVLQLPFFSNGDPSEYYLVPSFIGRYTPGSLFPGQDASASEAQAANASSNSSSSSGSGSNGSGSNGSSSSSDSSSASSDTTEEITGWTIFNVSLLCFPATAVSKYLNESLIQWQPGNTDDPLFLSAAPTNASSPPPSPDGAASTAVGRATVCTLNVHVVRMSSFYVWMDIVPVIITTAIAFSVLVTSPTAIDVRLGTVVTLFLALVALQFIIVDQLPKTSYITTFGAMVLTSYVVYFLIILESVLVYYIASIEEFHEHKQFRRSERVRLEPLLWAEETSDGSLPRAPRENDSEKKMQRSLTQDDQEPDVPNGEHSEGHDVSMSCSRKAAGDASVSKRQGRCSCWGRAHDLYLNLARGHFNGYRVACWIDWIVGPTLLLAYIIVMIVLFIV